MSTDTTTTTTITTTTSTIKTNTTDVFTDNTTTNDTTTNDTTTNDTSIESNMSNKSESTYVVNNKIANVYLCYSSQLVKTTVKSILDTICRINKQTTPYQLIESAPDLSWIMPEQMINEETARFCFTKIVKGIEDLRFHNISLSVNDLVISVTDGIYIDNNDASQIHHVCVLMVCSFGQKGEVVNIKRYNSFGIKIDASLFGVYSKKVFVEPPNRDPIVIDNTDVFYKNTVFSSKCDMTSDETYGEFLARLFNISNENWMADPRFGNIDHVAQITDAFEKYIIDSNTSHIPDYPKAGIMFKDMTPIMTNHDLLNIMYVMLERMITNNFDLSQIDYFAGLDARGFYLAPVLARVFKKGFIPVRKASKLPKSDSVKIVTASYDTEYSNDEFGLHYRDEYTIDTDKNKRKKTVLILDDLLATGGSIVGAAKVLEAVGLMVVGAVTVYDVTPLRSIAKTNLSLYNIRYNVLIDRDNVPTDFTKLFYEIPDIMFKRIDYMLQEARSPPTARRYTLTSAEWLKHKKMDIKQIDEFTIFNRIKPDEEKPETTYDGMTVKQLNKMDRTSMAFVRMIYTEKDKNLATKIIDVLKTQMNADPASFSEDIRANITHEKFSNGELRVKIDENIRNKHIIIVSQIRTNHINDDIVELLLIMDACNRASAAKITVVMPYYPYSRSDKKDDPRCPIAAAMMSLLLKALDTHNLISIDLHAGQIQGYLEKGFHNLYVKKYACEHIYKNYLRFTPKHQWNDEFILIAPDAGSARAIKDYSKILGINNVVLDKQRDYSKPGVIMRSRMIGDKKDLEGKTGIIIDDMGDTFGTMCACAKELIENGIKDVIVCVTHGVLSGEAIKKINETPYIKEVTVTDSLPQDDNVAKCPKLIVLSIAELIGRTINGIISGRSISRLF